MQCLTPLTPSETPESMKHQSNKIVKDIHVHEERLDFWNASGSAFQHVAVLSEEFSSRAKSFVMIHPGARIPASEIADPSCF